MADWIRAHRMEAGRTDLEDTGGQDVEAGRDGVDGDHISTTSGHDEDDDVFKLDVDLHLDCTEMCTKCSCFGNAEEFFVRLGTLVAMFGTCMNSAQNLFDSAGSDEWKVVILNVVVLLIIQIPTTAALIYFFLKRLMKAAKKVYRVASEVEKKTRQATRRMFQKEGTSNPTFGIEEEKEEKSTKTKPSLCEEKNSDSKVDMIEKLVDIISPKPDGETSCKVDYEINYANRKSDSKTQPKVDQEEELDNCGKPYASKSMRETQRRNIRTNVKRGSI